MAKPVEASDRQNIPMKNAQGLQPQPVPPALDASEATQQADSDAASAGGLPAWSCRIEGSPQDQAWTVGETFHLSCSGPSAALNSDQLVVKGEKKSGYELKILKVIKQSENSLEAEATSYVPKVHDFEGAVVEDQGLPVFKMDPLQLQVKSILKDPQAKPFPPYGPITLQWPMALWVSLGVALVLLLFFALFRFNRRLQMNRVIEELKQHNTALGAFNQFNKDLRVLGRGYIFGDNRDWPLEKKQRYIGKLEETFRMYLLREFFIPALDWDMGLISRTIRKQEKKRYASYGSDLEKLLKEFERAHKNIEKVQVHDCKQITQMSKKVTQSIWRERKAQS